LLSAGSCPEISWKKIAAHTTANVASADPTALRRMRPARRCRFAKDGLVVSECMPQVSACDL
jgi:hypothetical protein